MNDYLSKPFKQADWVALPRRRLGPVMLSSARPAESMQGCTNYAEHIECILDFTQFDDIRELSRDGKSDALVKFIDLYLQSSPALMGTLRAAVEANHSTVILHPARTLKSDSANLDVKALSLCCQLLECMGRSESAEGAKEIRIKLESQYQDTFAALLVERNKAT